MQSENAHGSTIHPSSDLLLDLTVKEPTAATTVDETGTFSSAVTDRNTSCGVCGVGVAKYTCPRCGFKSCSLSCVRAHAQGQPMANSSMENGGGGGIVPMNSQMGCSGVRENNAGGYVEMNSYGYSTFMRDYVFLEDVGRKVGEWGREIDKKRLDATTVPFSTTVPGKSQHMRGKKGAHGHARTKRDILKEKLEEEWDIDLRLLPEGMERRKSNQSTWDAKSDKGYLTAQFRFHHSFPPSQSKQASHDQPRSEKDPFILFSHRNELDSFIYTSLHKILRGKEIKRDRKQLTETSHTSGETASTRVPSWVSDMVPEKETGAYQVLVAADHISGPSKATSKSTILRRRYREVESSISFGEALRDLTVIEFPTFEIVPRGNYGTLLEGVEEDSEDKMQKVWAFDEDENEETGDEREEDMEERPRKKRKIDPGASKRLFGGLTVYRDDEDEDADASPIGKGSNIPAIVSGTQSTGLSLAYASEESEESELEDVPQLPDARAEMDEVDWD